MSLPPTKLMVVDVRTEGAMFQASVPHALFDVPAFRVGFPGPGNLTGPYSISPDGQRFLAAIQPAAEVSNPLSIVLNWTAMLKSK